MEKINYEDRELELTAKLFKKAIDKYGIINAIACFFGVDDPAETDTIDISIPINDDIKKMVINDMPFDDKTMRSLMRYSLQKKQDETIENIIPLIEKFSNIPKEEYRGIGKRRITHIKTCLLLWCYEELAEEQKLKFCMDFLRRNCD